MRQEGDRVYFDSIRIFGTTEEIAIRINDHILIENQDNPETPFVARLEQLYDNSSKRGDSKRAVVAWYLRAAECKDLKPSLKIDDIKPRIWKTNKFSFSEENFITIFPEKILT